MDITQLDSLFQIDNGFVLTLLLYPLVEVSRNYDEWAILSLVRRLEKMQSPPFLVECCRSCSAINLDSGEKWVLPYHSVRQGFT